MMNHPGRVRAGAAAPVEDRSRSWLKPCVFLVSVIVIKTALVAICIGVFLQGSHGQYKTLFQNAGEWCCIASVSAGKKESWTCCPKGWKRFQKSCYFISEDTMSWNATVQNCTGMGSHLVVINSKEEQEFLTRELQSSSQANYYIGLRARKVGEWHWIDQTPLTLEFWREWEPSNLETENCVVIHANPNPRNWNDVPCIPHRRACEAAAVTV